MGTARCGARQGPPARRRRATIGGPRPRPARQFRRVEQASRSVRARAYGPTIDSLATISTLQRLVPRLATLFAVLLAAAWVIDPTWTTRTFMAMVDQHAQHVTEQLEHALQPVFDTTAPHDHAQPRH